MVVRLLGNKNMPAGRADPEHMHKRREQEVLHGVLFSMIVDSCHASDIFWLVRAPLRLRVAPCVRTVTALICRCQVSAILEQCSSVLASSEFLFHRDWAHVITGDQEGLYGWTAANYVSGALEVG